MREGEQSDRIYVAADSSEVARCRWCGITKSEKWIITLDGLRCSRECAIASATRLILAISVFSVFMSFCFVVIVEWIHVWALLFFSFIWLVIALWGFSAYRKGKAHAASVPRNSRADDVPA